MKLKVLNPERMKLILRTFSWLDDIRWSFAPNYNLINYSHSDLTSDEKLLAHWICYITDRQMPFLRIWEVGGYVLSHLVRTFTRSRQPPESLVRYYMCQDGEYLGIQCPLEGPNSRLLPYPDTTGPVYFASRYIPEDLVRILHTLVLLDVAADRDFGKFMAMAIQGSTSHEAGIHRLAVALFGLTYSYRARVTKLTLDAALKSAVAAAKAQGNSIRKDPEKWLSDQADAFDPFGKKRLWCSVRDYLKSPEFNPQFVQALAAAGVRNHAEWERSNPKLCAALDGIELPGDVWNNNETFREGLFAPYIKGHPKWWDMPRIVRAIKDKMGQQLQTFHPEQLDVTFDFVQRMCEPQFCHFCAFGRGISQLCHAQKGKICPIPLVACGYEHVCDPDNCTMREDAVRGFCHRSVEKPDPPIK